MAELGKETCLGVSSEESGNPSSGSKRQNPSGLEAGSKRQKDEEVVYGVYCSNFNPFSGSKSQKDNDDDDDVYCFDEKGYFITPSPFRKKGLDHSKYNPSSASKSQKDKAVNPSSLDTQVVEEDDDDDDDVYRFDENGYFVTPSPFRKKGLDHSKYKNYKGVNNCLRPLTEGVKVDFRNLFGPRGNPPPLPVIKPLPGDEDVKCPLTEGVKVDFHNIFGPRGNDPPLPVIKPLTGDEDQVLLKRDPDAKCLDGDYLSPYCRCSKDPNACSRILTRRLIEAYPGLPVRALEKHRKHFIPIWLAYHCQTSQSHYFDIDDHPGSSFGASVAPLLPYKDFSGKLELLMELSNRAVQEYNEKDCHLYKYKVLKIEKVNFSASVGGNNKYWMTVKVVNLTLATPIETFQIHVGICVLTEEKVIYCCRPKEEMIDCIGLPNCDVCFRKVRDEERHKD